MADGIDRRAQIDQETVKALLLINGGGAIALLTLLPNILDKEGYRPLAFAILIGISILIAGLVLAIAHNRLRRKCSLIYEQHDMRPPRGKLLGILLPEPCVCFASTACMWLSMAAFIGAGIFVTINGIRTLNEIESKAQTASEPSQLKTTPPL